MFKRNIGEDDVRFVLEHGEIIIEYFDDTPYPSRLLLAWRKSRPLHVVAADNPDDQVTIIITAYEPDPSLWEADFKRKKRL
ncbi:MAG: DUF4258 domain-containing protein [Burkholderiales bacterium]|nr:DUF4258 domain-containing protein [Anaerolineae bacterium]